jgi:hypothetical protein
MSATDLVLTDEAVEAYTRAPACVNISLLISLFYRLMKYKMFQKELYNFEGLHKFIQRTCAVF